LDLNLTNKSEELKSIEGFQFLYPFGCSVSILKSETKNKNEMTIPLLTTGAFNFPVRESVLALHYNSSTKGRVLLSGAFQLFTDEYLPKEENKKLINIVFDIENKLPNTMKEFKIPVSQNFSSRTTVPSIEKMSSNLKCALECNPDLSSNIFSLFENNLFKVHFDLQREAIALHKRLNIERKNLTLISPVFETPMLGLTPAVFPPVLVDIDTPGLELYDLDDEFANPK
jgi:intraflagellar transport protein 52